MEVKDNKKMAAAQIKRPVTSKSAPVNSDSNESVRVPRKKRARTSAISRRKQQEGGKTPKHCGEQNYFVL